MNASVEDFVAELKELRENERLKLKTYGDGCSMGKCAMSRIHLLDSLLEKYEPALKGNQI